jgi:hypothetical protein
MPRPHRRPPPDHRWLRARQLVPLGKQLDPDRMAPYAVKVLPRGTALSGAALDQITAVVQEAIELREADDLAKRDDVEAWLLCELSPDDVALKTILEVAVVRAYRDLFFDLGPWLADDFSREDLAWHLLGDKLYVGIDESDFGAWKRFAAITGGPVVLNRLLEYQKAVPLIYPHDVSRMSDADLERHRDLLIVRHWVLSKAPLRTTAQRIRMEFVWTLQAGQRIWPSNMG